MLYGVGGKLSIGKISIYVDCEACIIKNGIQSEWFNMWQGCILFLCEFSY